LRRRKRSAKYDPENLNNFELIQEFEFEEGKLHQIPSDSASIFLTLSPDSQQLRPCQ
jgi:hypothetical protein